MISTKLHTTDHQKYTLWFGVIFLMKLVFLVLFSSDYQNKLFIPFLEHFLTYFHNPWEYAYAHPLTGGEFPYSPVMLYILSIFYAPVHWLNIQSPMLVNFFLKMPTLIADLMILWYLRKVCTDDRRVLVYYFATPIIIYAAYMHSQIDLIPTAFLFLSVYHLTRNRVSWAGLLLGLGVCTKFHIAAALPLMLMYIFHKRDFLSAGKFLLIALGVYVALAFPYFGEGYTAMVLNNPKQMLVYDSFISVADIKIYIPVLLVSILYARFAAFRKINTDLFFTFLALIFAAFVAFTKPAPGWYIWLFPFLSIFFIKFEDLAPAIFKLYLALNAAYLIYMIVFFLPEQTDLIFINQPWQWKIESQRLRNLSFTFLEVTLFASMYAFYKFGIKSNYFYKRNSPTVIGISGDSAAGKTTLLKDLQKLLGERVLKLEGDADHKWERGDTNWQNYTHLDPKANHLNRQYEDIINLQYGKSIYRSDYDHATGTFAAARKIKARDYVILSGLHAFYLPKMRKAIDLKIYVDTDEKLRRHWKVLRDMKERDYKREKVLAQITKREKDAKKYIHPQNDFADIVVHYFPKDAIAVGDPAAEVDLRLAVTINSNIVVDELIARLQEKFEVQWDYSQDLSRQTITIGGVMDRFYIQSLAETVIMNMEDLISEEPFWQDGYRGFIQLMVLLSLSEKIRITGGREHEVI